MVPRALRLQAVGPVLVVLLGSCALGMLTFPAQGFLPEALASFANSASGWTVLAASLVLWSRVGTWPAAVLGASSFVLLVLGYAVAADLAGAYYDPSFFGLVGVVVGPFVGVAAAWLRDRGYRAAVGAGLLGGICAGEAVYGLTVVGATTSPVYWTAIGAVGLALVGMVCVRARAVGPRVVAAVGAAAVAVAFVEAYARAGSIG
ncbi:hypothetical protein DNL40_10550 [Xylanimonas oleitrophica]|uniref:Uncharacterized protein n=1 Tax=Xylanimonas oleitrophica TaxID=2607479 RepID=A0A2W5Y4G9_9MICO|nr:hypothetical protein DNL40_10550 [Xylanimonas oleitrophica]